MSFLGSDTDELREAGQKCQEGAETTDEVIMFLRALVIALRAASFFTGGASTAYAQYLESTVIPWLQKVSAALKMFANVLLSQAKAQDDVSAGETVDFGQLPTYVSPIMPAGNTCDYPPVVAQTGGVAPATRVDGGTTGAAVSTTTNGQTVGVAPAAGSTDPGTTSTTAIGSTSVGASPAAPIRTDAAQPVAAHGGSTSGIGAATSPGSGIGVGSSPSSAITPGTGNGAGAGAGSPDQFGSGTPGSSALGGSDAAAATSTHHGSPASQTFGARSSVGGVPEAHTAPLTPTQSGLAGSGSFGTAAGIAATAGALGMGGAALANRRGKAGEATIEELVADHGRGSRGDDVRDLQERLTAAGYDTKGVDGQWGGDTQAAYEAWRADHPMEIRTGTGFTSPDGFDYSRIAGVEGNPNVTPEFLREMEGVAQRVGARPEDLMAVMALESDRTFAPDVRNGSTGATGLIQFMPATAEGLDTSTDALAGMTAREQLPYVEAYLAPRRGHLGDLESLYTSILYGSPQSDPDTTLWSSGQAAYGANHGLDRNGDGQITAGEAADSVRSFISN